MKLIKHVAILSSLIAPTLSYAAIPYHNETYQYTQPNGEVVSITLHGNTYYAEQRAHDGRLVVYDKSLGGLSYALVNKAGTDIESLGILVSDKGHIGEQVTHFDITTQAGLSAEAIQNLVIQKQDELLPAIESPLLLSTQSANVETQVTGQIKGLTIIIDFPDERGSITKSQVERFLNDQNYTEFGNAQSVRGYFLEVSDNKLDYTNTVTAYYTAKKNKAYYADSSLSSTVRSQELIKEALDWLEYQQGFDFSTLSTNSSNQIRGLNIFYAGNSDSSWSKGLWPHMARLSPRFCADGVCTDRYQITDMRASLSIGTFVHESGHLITNWPDLYDYDGSSHGSVASYGVMGFGAIGTTNKFKPTPPVAHFRAIAGWDTVTELNPAVDQNAPKGVLTHTSGAHTSYKWTNPSNRNEAFYIEAIHQSGQNSEQPGQGLAIWHVDSRGSNSNEWYPYIQMEHADGNRDPENKRNRGDGTDLFIANGEFSKLYPNSLSSKGTNSLWWNGSDSGLSISGISDPAKTISFTVESSVVEPPKGETYRGTLSNKAQQIQPNGSWFQYAGGTISLDLTGPSNADFDLKLERWQGGGWTQVSISETPTSVESISYSAANGYYRIVVYSYSGAGDYTLIVNK
ncbi:M6 family metalloprotease domain-containing protein [Pseudoalteromonas luteoviolacea]|uniref:M6 family metalloprotease domain-containing protein n=1 Tax=Pseudoalteromonas luteoviolacea TaxID=43657 RepID=UPI001EEF6719|nr:M6 family metalloprotease domain-containing protein [Pseudoalteromonas luteoviolacea]MCF6442583.1 M6 family metalloprotease domain-containing protein [Pseudoalteromonas luteoviolacea]